MSDYLGPNQSRVLDTENRNWESVIYQWRKPPLSSEYNLSGKIPSEDARLNMKYLIPSGWAIDGNFKDGISANECFAGDVLTSSSFSSNTVRLIALDKGVETKKLLAFVNGHRVLVQGSNSSSDENNTITLNAPPTTGARVDFIFLEVWRKLIEPEDTVYKYGNVLYGGTNPTNDLIDSAVGIETSFRVQIQYRIRVVDDIDIETYPSGFDPNKVFVQGPLSAPISTCSNAYYTQMADDIGLWRAGAGDSVAQEELETVDGYVYAIPMFAVIRRNTTDYDPDTATNGAGRSLSDYLSGLASDRPDNLYNDWIVADDILDMRHVVAPEYNMKEICEKNLRKLMAGNLRTKIEKSTLGEDHYGKVLVHADAVSNVDEDGSDKIAKGDGVARYFGNAEHYQPDSILVRTVNDKTVGTVGGNWTTNDEVQIEVDDTDTYAIGSQVVSIEEAFTQDGALVITTDYVIVTSLPASQVTIRIPGTSSLVGTSDPIRLDYTIHYPSNTNAGLSYVPDTFLEFRKEETDSSSIASQDMGIRVRDAGPVVATDGTKYHMLHNAGAYLGEQSDFGHQMIYHALGNGTQVVTFDRTAFGYNILGVASVMVDSTYRSGISVSRTSSQYTVDVNSPAVNLNKDVILALYTDKKFFEVNKQGRAIKDCFEMRELIPLEDASGQTQFTLDATNQAILAIGSYITDDGAGFAYVNDSKVLLSTNNDDLPLDTTKSRVTIDFVSAPAPASEIRVPVLLRSAITDSEGYTFFYQRTPYQGLLDGSAHGSIEGVGPAYVTTAGSGAITDASYTIGTASFTADSTIVQGTGTQWVSNVDVGDIIISNADTSNEYRINQLIDDDTLYIASPAVSSNSGAYTVTKKDQPHFGLRNIIDRLPALNANNDASAHSEAISTAVTDADPVLQTRIISPVQDILDQSANTVSFGPSSAARGRSTISIPGAPLGLGNLSLKFEKLDTSGQYQKTYQSYVFDKDSSGELYLMVVGSETDNTSVSNFFNQSSNSDVVDIFKMEMRPISMRRNK